MVIAILGLPGVVWAFDGPPFYDGTAEWYLAEHEAGSLDPETQLAVQQAAFDHLQEQVVCAASVASFQGSTDDWESGPRSDDRVTVCFDDPTDIVPDGVLAMTLVSGSTAWSPEVQVEPGPVEVRLRVAGIAGEASDSLEAKSSGSCSTASSGGLADLLLGLLAVGRRRA